jgi:hypothetical protein
MAKELLADKRTSAAGQGRLRLGSSTPDSPQAALRRHRNVHWDKDLRILDQVAPHWVQGAASKLDCDKYFSCLLFLHVVLLFVQSHLGGKWTPAKTSNSEWCCIKSVRELLGSTYASAK